MANTYDKADLVKMQTTIKVDGVLTAPTTIALSVRWPDGTTTTPALTNPSTGVYYAEVSVTQAGTYSYRFVATGAAQGGDEGSFTVRSTVF